ncbi:auxin-responsive protein SAUR71-like [Lolium rigidum]|uniref:auxin-responsive protein SAUR71-like n=1 Tax=Lolium rigidum TaxID=89674 RepID=UPI001F5D357F|nr:auxin-responsive protein SAUR71-like [Lolium rigidum]XP_047075001.1 auxin-responsive protein SAUR71-like [Lolium rigidum]
MRELIRRLSFSDRVSDGSGGVPRGCVPLLVVGDGDEESERFVVRVEALRHPSLAALLEMAAQEFGYKQEGILRVPCAVHQFKQALSTAGAVSTKY